MKKIKSQQREPKIKGNISTKCPDKISISFKYLTQNSKHNFKYFTKDKKKCLLTKANLYDKLEEICSENWLYWNGQNKQLGIETLDASRLTFQPSDYEFSKDEKVIIFRFYNQNCRIIGFKTSCCSTYDIIGFDFDYSAYDHGK